MIFVFLTAVSCDKLLSACKYIKSRYTEYFLYTEETSVHENELTPNLEVLLWRDAMWGEPGFGEQDCSEGQTAQHPELSQGRASPLSSPGEKGSPPPFLAAGFFFSWQVKTLLLPRPFTHCITIYDGIFRCQNHRESQLRSWFS